MEQQPLTHVSLAVLLVVPAVATTLLTPVCIRWLERNRLTAVNYRGKRIASAGGLLFVFFLLLLQPFYWLAFGDTLYVRLFIFPAAAALLGLADDVWGDTEYKGLAGHLRALWQQGTWTTGLLKAAGGLGAGIPAAAMLGGGGPPSWILGGAFLALCANLLNLFDTRPERAAKVFLVLSSLLLLHERRFLFLLAPYWSALPVYLAWESEKKVMLGDTGAYLLGGTLGVFGLLVLGEGMQMVLLGVLLLLHGLGERYSLSSWLENRKPV